MGTTIPSVRGMHDVLPSEIGLWHLIEQRVRQVMRQYGYQEMRTPLVERTALFHRSIGEVTDIVEKEMYSFLDRKAESLSLRPEATASCVRAALQHGLLQPGQSSRIWYQGPMFRYERPQMGRTRQFHQVGAEAYGIAGPVVEAELIALSARLWESLGIDDLVQLEINTLGSATDRDRYREVLVEYFSDHQSSLDDDSIRRLGSNPLRILDSKNPAMAELLSCAPAMGDHLGDESREHFEQLQALLVSSGLNPIRNQRLVRGLDYYSHSVFEWTTDRLGSQSAVCAGGRYDGLIEELGGKPAPGVGWALGMERLIGLLETVLPEGANNQVDAFLIVADDVSQSSGIALAEWLRTKLPFLSLMHHVGGGSIKSQFKRADKSGARFALVYGESEDQNNKLTLKFLRTDDPASRLIDGTESQISADKADIATLLADALSPVES